jgi:hypothetical protein
MLAALAKIGIQRPEYLSPSPSSSSSSSPDVANDSDAYVRMKKCQEQLEFYAIQEGAMVVVCV